MRDMDFWVTAIFAAYRHLPRAVRACRQTSASLAESGFYCEDTLALVNKLIDCNARAESYINAKVLADEALSKLPLKYAQLLSLRARGDMSMEEIAAKLGYSKRSAFRWFAEGIKKAACVLKAEGYDEEWFSSRYSKDVLIGNYYQQAKKGADVFCRAGNSCDRKKFKVRLEDAVAAGLLLKESRVASIACCD